MFDALLEARIPALKRPGAIAAFWDVDAPATLDRIAADPDDPFRKLIPDYDIVFTYGGGPPVVAALQRRLAPEFACRSITGSTRRPIIRRTRDPRFACDLGLVANRLPDRERRIDEYFLSVAAELRERDFVLAGVRLGRQEDAAERPLCRPPLHGRS